MRTLFLNRLVEGQLVWQTGKRATTIVSVPRTYLDDVITEYGVVDLLGKSQRERADLLISIDYPDFRDEPQQAAKALFWP
jgi:acyl-CoA hydrolase